MSDIATRCDIAADTLCQIAQGSNFRPRYTPEQAMQQTAQILREAGDRIRRADVHMFDQCNQIYVLETALVEERKPWWQKVWEKWHP